MSTTDCENDTSNSISEQLALKKALISQVMKQLEEGTESFHNSVLSDLTGYLACSNGRVGIVCDELESVFLLPTFIKTKADFERYDIEMTKVYQAGIKVGNKQKQSEIAKVLGVATQSKVDALSEKEF